MKDFQSLNSMPVDYSWKDNNKVSMRPTVDDHAWDFYDQITLFMPFEELKWDPAIGRLVPKRRRHPTIHEMYEQDREEERVEELRQGVRMALKEYEEQYGVHLGGSHELSDQLKKDMEEFEAILESMKSKG